MKAALETIKASMPLDEDFKKKMNTFILYGLTQQTCP